jgi:Polyketide synthase dehydratase domain/Polyketide synthase dehydratase N-terminal domain
MESVSKITEKVRLTLNINVPPYLMDHRFQGRAVLPAVEAMEILAVSTITRLPGTAVHCIQDVSFDKFLVIEDGQQQFNAFNDLEIFENGTVVSKLITKKKSKKAMITRTLEHATLCFKDVLADPVPAPLEIPTGPEYHISVSAIYKSLVPFGPSYQNLKDVVAISEKGAISTVYAPPLGGFTNSLGSPFPLDAAFHAACVWGQRYTGLVGFPVSFGLRRLFVPTCSGNIYTAKIFSKEVHSDRFLVDIWITDTDGTLQEVALDVVMKDVSGGRIKPPSWIAMEKRND